MTESELLAVMTGGMATVADGVMAAYVGMLKPYIPNIAGHLLSASIMSAPAALVMAKLMIPETEKPLTAGVVKVHYEKTSVNIIDAAARGAADGLKFALNVGAVLLIFFKLISPARLKVIARPGIRSIIAGSLAAFMTATIAGIPVS